jgi:hypothetical protein
MTDEAVIAALTHGGARLEDYVLIGRDGERPSIFTGHPTRGLATLLVEEEAAKKAYVAFLEKRGVRRYSTIKGFADAIGSDGISRVEPVDE